MLRKTVVPAAVIVLLLAAPAHAALGDTSLVSLSGLFGPKANAFASQAAISADGRFVAFGSGATNLDPADTDPGGDVYVRDLTRGTVTLVSRATGANGAAGNGESRVPLLSGDGRFVAFTSEASNLDPADGDTAADVFVRDLQQHTTKLASRATGPAGAGGNGFSLADAISADGRFIAFESTATNIHPDDPDLEFDVFMRDVRRNTTILVSRSTSAVKGNGPSGPAAMSGDGRYVAFLTLATNLTPDDGDPEADVVLRDTEQNTTTLISRAAGATGVKGNGESSRPAISADGSVVAFQSNATNLTAADQDIGGDVIVRDWKLNTTTLASRASGANGVKSNVAAHNPQVSADGRFVTFDSLSTTLDPADGDGFDDVFMRDLQHDTTTLVSRATGGVKGNNSSFLASVSGDGRYAAFNSQATNLDADDADGTSDVFVRDVLGPPPVVSAAPRITGRALVGERLACGGAVFANGPVTVTLRWLRDGANLASGNSYLVTAADVGRAITCVATGTNPGGSISAESTAVVPPAPGVRGPAGPAATPLVFLAQSRQTGRAGRRVVVAYVATVSGDARLAVFKGRRQVLARSATARVGRNTIALRSRRLKPGRYTLRLRITAGGQTKTDTGGLRLTRR